MSGKYNLDTQQHRSYRAVLRVVGPLMLIAGALLTLIGIGGFFTTFLEMGKRPPRFHDGPPPGIKLFFLAFLGMPILAIGAMITKFAYLGAVARYIASEGTPVAKDATNYMIDGTKDTVGDLAQSVGAGIAAGIAKGKPYAETETVHCPSCDQVCDSGARFCSHCGTLNPGDVRCTACDAMNAPDARFCDQCGQATGA